MWIKASVIDDAANSVLKILGRKLILDLVLELQTLCQWSHNICIIRLLICLILGIGWRRKPKRETGIIFCLTLHLSLIKLLLLFDLLRPSYVYSDLLWCSVILLGGRICGELLMDCALKVLPSELNLVLKRLLVQMMTTCGRSHHIFLAPFRFLVLTRCWHLHTLLLLLMHNIVLLMHRLEIWHFFVLLLWMYLLWLLLWLRSLPKFHLCSRSVSGLLGLLGSRNRQFHKCLKLSS